MNMYYIPSVKELQDQIQKMSKKSNKSVNKYVYKIDAILKAGKAIRYKKGESFIIEENITTKISVGSTVMIGKSKFTILGPVTNDLHKPKKNHKVKPLKTTLKPGALISWSDGPKLELAEELIISSETRNIILFAGTRLKHCNDVVILENDTTVWYTFIE